MIRFDQLLVFFVLSTLTLKVTELSTHLATLIIYFWKKELWRRVSNLGQLGPETIKLTTVLGTSKFVTVSFYPAHNLTVAEWDRQSGLET